MKESKFKIYMALEDYVHGFLAEERNERKKFYAFVKKLEKIFGVKL